LFLAAGEQENARIPQKIQEFWHFLALKRTPERNGLNGTKNIFDKQISKWYISNIFNGSSAWYPAYRQIIRM